MTYIERLMLAVKFDGAMLMPHERLMVEKFLREAVVRNCCPDFFHRTRSCKATKRFNRCMEEGEEPGDCAECWGREYGE